VGVINHIQYFYSYLWKCCRNIRMPVSILYLNLKKHFSISFCLLVILDSGFFITDFLVQKQWLTLWELTILELEGTQKYLLHVKIRKNFKGYRCESNVALFKHRVTWNSNYSPFKNVENRNINKLEIEMK